MRAAELDGVVGPVVAVDEAAAQAAAVRHDTLAKPPGSLGALERLGARLAAIARSACPPAPARPAVVIAAADHGVHAQGVTAWPQTVTTTMVEAFCAGSATVNQVAAAVGAQVSVLDVGCVDPPRPAAALRSARVRAGTADLSAGPATTRQEAVAAVAAGAALAGELVADGVDLLVTGDMGIANTTASACLVAAFADRPAVAVTGPGAGADEVMLARKRQVVDDALALHAPDPADPLGVLAAVGGLEHAALVGVILAGASARVPVLLDGLISGAAALAAVALVPPAGGYLVAGHRSPEPGADVALERLALEPLLGLELRLGEGAGGLLAVPLVVAAARVLAGTATIEELLAAP